MRRFLWMGGCWQRSLLVICSILIAFTMSLVPATASKTPAPGKTPIIIGGEIDYPPYSFLDKNGKSTGFQVELTRAIAKTMGMNVEIRLSSWSEARKALEDGTIDLIPGMFYSEERTKTFDFSPPHSIVSDAIFTRTNSPSIKSVEDLRNKEIIVMRDEVMHDYILKHRLTDRILLTETPGDALRLLASGKGDYALVAQMPGFYWIKELKLSNIKTVGPSLEPFKNCYAVRRGNTLLLSRFTEGLNILKQTGEYQRLYEKWLGILEPNQITPGLAIKYAAIVFVPLILLLALSLLWSWMLRSKVDQKTKELRESERKFRETVINLDEGYYSVTLDGVLLEHNQAFSRILGFDQAADLKGKQMPDFWQNPDERNSYLKELAAKGSINGHQTKAKTKTGEKITVIISAHLVKDKDSLPLRIEGVVLDITERKRFEDQLQASEARLRSIVDSTPFPMAIVDVEDDNIEYWSRSALELFGHTAPTTTEWYQLAYPDPEYRREVIERWKPFLEKARLCGEPVNTGEYRVSCHDGSARICELYATFLSNRLVVTFNDITERVQAEEALRIREKDLRESQRIAHVGSWSLNVATKQVVWSEELYKMYGFDPALPPPPYTEHMKLFTPESWERLSTALAHTRETGIPYTLELETVREDGSTGWMWVHGEADIDSAGKTVGLWGAAQDITAHKQAEEELKKRENLMQKVFDVLPIGLWFADKDGKLLRGNSAGVKIWGAEPQVSPSEYGVFKARRLPSREELAPGDWALAHTIREGVTIVDELLEIDAFDGKKKIILNYTAPVLDENGTIQGAVVANLDITDRKRAESQREAALAEINRLNTKLEQKVDERTAELHNSQLALLNLVDDLNQNAKKTNMVNQTLEETNKELAAFSYSVSHDLRAPLRSIDGFSLALLEDYQSQIDDTAKNYLHKIRAAAQHMGLLIEDMLKLSRITHAEFHHESIDLSKIVRSIAETLKQSNPDKDAKITIQEGIVINGDLNAMKIALTNILDNAWKFTGKTENAHIEFGMTLSGYKKVFFIRDNGAGFDMAYAGKLFGAFQRLHGFDEFPGTGIGLATVKRIITRHGGQIWAEGEVDKGAVFYFTLPE